MEELSLPLSSSNQAKQTQFSDLSFQGKLSFMLSILRSALPLIISLECFPISNIINLFWLRGYENSDVLVGAFGLGFVWANFWVGALTFSLNQGLSVLVSHAFGAKDYRLCGIYYQRAIIICFIMITPLFLFLWYSTEIMVLLGVEQELAETTRPYTRSVIISQIGFALFDSTKAFIIAQKVFDPIIYMQVITIGLHCIWSFLFIHVFKLGIVGAAMCRIFEEWGNCALIYIYIKKSGKFQQTFIPWADETLDKTAIKKQLKFTLPLAGVTYFEFIYFEFMMIMAGMLGTDQIVAHLAVYQTSSLTYLFFLGISIATMSLIGNAIGEKNIVGAKNYFKGGLYIMVGFCLFADVFLRIYRSEWFGMWTVNPEITDIIFDILIIWQLFVLPFDCLMNSIFSLLKATDKQDFVSRWNLIGLYLVGAPLTIIGIFMFGFKAPGMWTAFALALAVILWKIVNEAINLNWQEVVDKIHKRLQESKGEIELEATH